MKSSARSALGDHAVHLYFADLDSEAGALPNSWTLLSADEIEKAERFRFAQDREHYVTGRALLRAFLGHYLACHAADLRFDYGLQGKPFLLEPAAAAALHFNVSHSHGHALYAFTEAGAIGVDLEWIRPAVAMEEIAQRFFSPAEQAELRELAAAERAQGFYRLWTRKEALLKAHGIGLGCPLDQVTVGIQQYAVPQPVTLTSPGETEESFGLQDVKAPPGSVAAVAVKGVDFRVEYWGWQRTEAEVVTTGPCLSWF